MGSCTGVELVDFVIALLNGDGSVAVVILPVLPLPTSVVQQKVNKQEAVQK